MHPNRLTANSDYEWVGFPATAFCHTAGWAKAWLLLEPSSNKSALDMGEERHPVLIHVTDRIKRINQAGCFHELTHSLTHSLARSLTHSLAHSLATIYCPNKLFSLRRAGLAISSL